MAGIRSYCFGQVAAHESFMPIKAWKCLAFVLFWSTLLPSSWAQFVAFNDYSSGAGTSTNATTYGPPGGGVLKNITDGTPTGVTVNISNLRTVASTSQSSPTYGTPAFIVFDGFVDFVGAGFELAATNSSIVTYDFSGLDPNAEYNFQGTAIRGDSTYVNRWTLFELVGASSFTSAHTTGTLTSASVPAITAAQVAVNTGDNSRGDLAWWEHIRPDPAGTFSVTSVQYTNTVPGGSSGGVKSYAMTGFRLQKTGVYSGRTSVPPRVPNPALNSINGVKTVFMILMENTDWKNIKGNANCPYINNTLLPMASYATKYYTPPGNHPSEPNYIWLISGTNFGIRNDNPPANNHKSSTANLFTQLDQAGISWKTYQENISGTDVPDVDAYPYGVRHNPFVFFDAVRNNLTYCSNHVRPYPELATNLTDNTVARFNFITPNVTNDMHDTVSGGNGQRQGDNWLKAEVPKILASQAYTNGGLLIITWDEAAGNGDGPIGMIVLSPRAKGGGYNNTIRYSHSSTVRTLQDIFGVRPYLGDAINAENLDDLFKTPRITLADSQLGSFRLTVTNLIALKTNWIQASPTISPANWVSIKTNIATSTSLTYTNSSPLPAQRFYRVVELP
jgi:hypothetical protein